MFFVGLIVGFAIGLGAKWLLDKMDLDPFQDKNQDKK